jgi:hypothetical protein
MARLNVFDAIRKSLYETEHNILSSGAREPRITIELQPDDWMEFKRSLTPMFYPMHSAEPYKLNEVEIYGHKIKAYYPKR